MSFIWNIYEKSFTPYYVRLAPKNQVHKHKIQEQPTKISTLMQSNSSKQAIRFIRRHILHNVKLYYASVLLCKKMIINI